MGACTVLIDNRPVRSCLLSMNRAEGKNVVTLQGLETPEHPDPVQDAFIQEKAFQCGYCMNDWIMTTKALLARNPHPTEAEIRSEFQSLVCRCRSHVLHSGVGSPSRQERREGLTTPTISKTSSSRRDFFKQADGLVVGFSLASTAVTPILEAPESSSPRGDSILGSN